MCPTNVCELPLKRLLILLRFLTNRGNALLIGSIGAHLNSLAALALYMLEYPIHPVDCTYPNTFLDGLRSAVRQAGCDGKTTTVLFTVSMLPGCVIFGLSGVIGNITLVWFRAIFGRYSRS